MKIIQLHAENIKRLSAVEVTPEGALVEITGKNGAGKTSVLDAIWWALAGESDIQSQPIRRGQDKAIVKLDLGDLKITRRFNRQEGGTFTTSLIVENAEGMRPRSPQTLLDTLVAQLTFDPLAFTRQKPAEQVDALRALVPGVDFKAIEKANRDDYAARTEENRRAREARTIADRTNVEGAPEARVDEAALIAALEEAGQHNAKIAEITGLRERYADETTRLTENVVSLRGRLDALRKQVVEMEDQLQQADAVVTERRATLAKASPLPEPKDTTAIRQQIAEAREANEAFDALQSRNSLIRQAERAEAEAARLTKAMEDRNAAKAKAIAEADLGVPGLTLGEDAVMLGDVPFDQASDAEQLRASIAIAAAMNPKLRVLRVRDGSLLDADSMALLAEFAKAHDFQIWVESVSSGRPGAVVIEDGHVKEKATPKAQREAEGQLL